MSAAVLKARDFASETIAAQQMPFAQVKTVAWQRWSGSLPQQTAFRLGELRQGKKNRINRIWPELRQPRRLRLELGRAVLSRALVAQRLKPTGAGWGVGDTVWYRYPGSAAAAVKIALFKKFVTAPWSVSFGVFRIEPQSLGCNRRNGEDHYSPLCAIYAGAIFEGVRVSRTEAGSLRL